MPSTILPYKNTKKIFGAKEDGEEEAGEENEDGMYMCICRCMYICICTFQAYVHACMCIRVYICIYMNNSNVYICRGGRKCE
jgi:hypothetical protein